MKAREQRVSVLIPARVRWGGSWSTASIRNISSRGMMLRIAVPPSPGTYVEVQLNGRIITARAVWSADQSCGLQTQDKLDIGALGGTRAAASPSTAPARPVRAPARLSSADAIAQSRRRSSLMQYATFAVVGLAAASSLGWEVYQTLSAPMNAIATKLV